MATTLLEGELTGQIIAAFFRVYDVLGFGYLESVYVGALVVELQRRGLRVEREVTIDVWYLGVRVGHFRADLLVEGRVLVEAKASEIVPDTARKKIMNYLRGSALEVGLLLHFGPRASFKRIIYTNDHKGHTFAVTSA